MFFFSNFPSSPNFLSTFLGQRFAEEKQRCNELLYLDRANRIWERANEEGRDLLNHWLPH